MKPSYVDEVGLLASSYAWASREDISPSSCITGCGRRPSTPTCQNRFSRHLNATGKRSWNAWLPSSPPWCIGRGAPWCAPFASPTAGDSWGLACPLPHPGAMAIGAAARRDTQVVALGCAWRWALPPTPVPWECGTSNFFSVCPLVLGSSLPPST